MSKTDKANSDVDNFFGQLYSQRLIILLETEPQSNKYNQVLLNEAQFSKVSDAVASQFPIVPEKNLKEGHEIRDMGLSEEIYSLPSEINDVIEPTGNGHTFVS